MDNQLIQSQVWLNRLILIIMISMLIFAISVLGLYWQKISDPYVREVLSLNGNVDKGYAIFQINCAGCHGLQEDRSVGPSLDNVSKRMSKLDIIQQVTSGRTPPMPKFQPSYQEMADLLNYLEKL